MNIIILSREVPKKETTEFVGFIAHTDDKLYRLDWELHYQVDIPLSHIRDLMNAQAKIDLDDNDENEYIFSTSPASELDGRVQEYVANGWTLRDDL